MYVYLNGSQVLALGSFAGPAVAAALELGSNAIAGDETADLRFAEVAIFEKIHLPPEGVAALYRHGAQGFPARYFPGGISTLWEMETINVGQIDDVRSGLNPLTVSNVTISSTGQTYLSEVGNLEHGTTYALTAGGTIVDDNNAALSHDTAQFEGEHWSNNHVFGDVLGGILEENAYDAIVLPSPAISMVPQTGRNAGPIFRPHQTKLNRGIM
jgi:hypothetical protein